MKDLLTNKNIRNSNFMFNWLHNEEKRKILSFLGAGIVVVAGGLWSAYVYFDKSAEQPSKPQTTISTGDIHSSGDTVVGSGTIDKRTYNYAGITEIELAKQLGIAETAVKNFLKLLDQKQIPIEQWDHTLRQLAKHYKELQARAAQLESEDPQIKALQKQAIQSINIAEFEKAEEILDRAVKLDNVAADMFKENYIKRKRSAAYNQAIKAASLHTRMALQKAISAYKQAIIYAKEGEDTSKVARYQWILGMVYADALQFDQAISSYETALNHYLTTDGNCVGVLLISCWGGGGRSVGH